MKEQELKKIGGRKALVLMTDGENTIASEGMFHTGADKPVADALTAKLCTNIKSAEITVFTVAFQLESADVKAILDTFASQTEMAFDAANSEALSAAFNTIGTQLAELYLSR